ncbi:MAG: sugar phosphate isomerase/epimerase [Erysipelotrichaceae bacterium]|nr:sugar phosphate isomerase/epimerase [Erysipelotrichaceae bacterium]
MKYKIGLNAYGLRFVLGNGITEAMKTIRELGFESFEPMVNCEEAGKNQNPKYPNLIWDYQQLIDIKEEIRQTGIEINSVHVVFNKESDPYEVGQGMRKLYEEAGIRNFVFADGSMSNPEDLQRDAFFFNRILYEVDDIDVNVIYHPHENEFARFINLSLIDTLMLMCPDMKLQPDIGWITFAGEDPVEFINKYQNRVNSIHFKDLIREFGPEIRRNSFTAVGKGVVRTDEVIELLPGLNLSEYGVIICQDNSNEDYLEDLRNGVNYLRSKTEG